MKKILLAVIVVLITSCSAARFSQDVYISDFRPYTEDGFTISPYHEGYQYESVGLIDIEFTAGRKNGYVNPAYHWRSSISGAKYKDWYQPDYDYMLNELVNQAKQMGANGILDLRCTVEYDHSEKTTVSVMSGFAVIIKK